jgi:hypothetical protein
VWIQAGARRRVLDPDALEQLGGAAGRRAPVEAKVACLQMLLGALGRPAAGLVELGRDCERYRGYPMREGGGLDGLYYAGFATFVTAEFGLDARVAAPLGLAQAVAGDHVVLASVNKTIRTPAEPPPARGGHLVLVIEPHDRRDGRRVRGRAASWRGRAAA